MKRKLFCILLFLLSLTACNKETTSESIAETPIPTASDETPIPTASDDTPIPAASDETRYLSDAERELLWDIADLYDTSECEDWQIAYMEYVREEVVAGILLEAKMAATSDRLPSGTLPSSYWLYDLNHDEIPELLIEYGTCEADYSLHFFTYKEEQVLHLGSTNMAHASLYPYADGSGVLLVQQHMDNYNMEKYCMQNDTLVCEKLAEGTVDPFKGESYPEPTDFSAESDNLNSYPATTLLPILEYKMPPGTYAKTHHQALTAQQVRQHMENVFEGIEPVCGIPFDQFGAKTGTVFWDTFFSMDSMGLYNTPEIVDMQYIDMNHDGQKDCVLSCSYRDDEINFYVILSVFDNIVYAYTDMYNSGTLLEDGTIKETFFEDFYFHYEYNFYKMDCYYHFL